MKAEFDKEYTIWIEMRPEELRELADEIEKREREGMRPGSSIVAKTIFVEKNIYVKFLTKK